MNTLIWIGIVFLIITIILVIIDTNNKPSTILILITAYIGSGFIMAGGIEKNNKFKPTALDVYRGKTTLEITYKDNIPVDSVVIFK